MIRAIFTFHDGKTEILDRPAAMYKKHWSAAGVGFEQVQLADMVVLVNLESGKTVVLKNRYGQTRGSINELIADSEMHEIGSRFAGTPADHKRYLPGNARVTFGTPPTPTATTTHVLPNKICRCPIADLLSNGHNDGCPEKR